LTYKTKEYDSLNKAISHGYWLVMLWWWR